MRVKITFGYHGGHFYGFQQQTQTDNTVVGALSTALKRLHIKDTPKGSGRTDRGVHATHQVVHLDLPLFWKDLNRLKEMLNLQLPSSIRIQKVEEVSNDFHARYSAKKRTYRYVFKIGQPNPFETELVTFIPSLNQHAIKEAIGLFKGTHNFEYFKKTGSDTENHIRTIYSAYAYSYKNYFILCFEANGFLRSQIRMMVAFLMKISDGTLTTKHLLEQLSLREKYSTDLAPYNGLYLTRIKY